MAGIQFPVMGNNDIFWNKMKKYNMGEEGVYDLSDATLEMYMTDGDLEALAGIYKLCGVTNTLSNVIQMIGLTTGPDGVMPIVLEYNSDTGEVTFVGNEGSGVGDATIVNPGIPGEGGNS